MRKIFAAATLALMTLMGGTALGADKPKVLVVVSSAPQLELQGGVRYDTGYFLNELAIPVQALVQAGYEPVFANPKGTPAIRDAHSVAPVFFGGDQAKLDDAVRFVDSLDGLKHPRTLASVRAQGIAGFDGIFVPGGHAPMQDLLVDGDLGALLAAFHAAGKPTGLICHGPVALLSALPDPAGFHAAMVSGNTDAAQKMAAGWPYADYRMTAFTTAEERVAETGQLGGKVLFYPADALAEAGGRVERGPSWKSEVVQDRELITGQQPFSDEAFSVAMIKALKRGR